MLNLFRKQPARKLEKQYKRLLEKARDAQRSGDIKLYAELSSQAEDVWDSIELIKKES